MRFTVQNLYWRLYTVGVYMSHNLNSLKGGYVGDHIENYYRGY